MVVILKGMAISSVSHSEEGLVLRLMMKPQGERSWFEMVVRILPLSELGMYLIWTLRYEEVWGPVVERSSF